MEITVEKINARSDAYQLFLDSIRNESTKKRYQNLLYTFLKLVPNKIYTDSLDKTPKNRLSISTHLMQTITSTK